MIARQWVLGHSQSTAAARAVLNEIAMMADDDGICWPHVSTIAANCGISERTTQRALQTLEELGELEIERAPGRGARSIFHIAGMRAKGDNVTPFQHAKGDNLTPFENEKGDNLTPIFKKGDNVTPFESRKGDNLTPFQHKKGDKSAIAYKEESTTLTTDDDDLTRSSSSSSLRTQKRKAPPDDGRTFRFGLWATRVFSAAQLRNGAWHLALEHGLHAEWAGFEQWLQTSEGQHVLELLKWLAFYGNKEQRQLDRIQNLTGVLRKHLKEDERAALNASQVEMLERYCSMPLAEEIVPVGPIPAPRADMAWVAA